MNQDLHYWISRWKDVQLPAFAATGQLLRSMLHRAEQARPQAIADIALRDPVFTLQALRGINGMSRGRYGSPVLDMGNVVLLLGPRRFIEQFEHIPSLEGTHGGEQALRAQYLLLVRRARLAALLAAEWGRLRLDMKGEELYLAALLHPLRDWLLMFDADLQQAVTAGGDEAKAQLDWLQSRAALAIYAGLLESWRLPEHFIDLFMEDRQHTPRSQCVALAVRLAHQLEKGWYDPEVTEILSQTATTLKLDPELLWPLVRQILLREARQHPVPDILPLAALLPLLPPAPPAPAGAPAAAASAEPELSLPEKGVLVLRTLPADVPFKRVLALALQVLHKNFGLARLVLLMPDGRRLRPRQTSGDDSWQGFDIPLDGQQLFARVMAKSQTLWMHCDNRQRLLPLLGSDELRLLGEDAWLAASLCRPGQPLALIIAARARGASPLDSGDYLSFQRLAQELIRRLG